MELNQLSAVTLQLVPRIGFENHKTDYVGLENFLSV